MATLSVIASTRWIALTQAFRVGGQLVSMTVLTRLLQPEDYGLMAMAAVVINLAYAFRDLGTAGALIQKPELRPALADSVFCFNLGLGCAIAAAMVLGAGAMARYFGEPELQTILYILAGIFPVAAFGLVPQALLERETRFDRVARAEILSSLLALGLALLLAQHGAGVYALVAQTAAAALLTTAFMWRTAGWRPAWNWDWREFKGIWKFSSDASLFQLVNYGARNADALIIGRILGAIALGVYSLAYRIMLFPVQNLTAVASRALFPVLSRRQDRREEAAYLYLKAVCTIAFVTAPLMTGLWCLRSLFVDVVLGPKWHGTVVVLAWLAPVGFIQSLVSSTGAVFSASGETGPLLKLGILGAVLMTAAFLVGSHWGIEGVAQAYLIANVANAVPALTLAARVLGLPMKVLAGNLARILFFAFAMAAVVLAAQALLANTVVSPVSRLALLVAIGIAAYGLFSTLYLKPQQQWFLTLLLHRRSHG